jgi:hypothetical protein
MARKRALTELKAQFDALQQADVVTQAKWLAEAMVYATQLHQEITARLGRLSGPEFEEANRRAQAIQELLHLLEKPVALLTHPDVVNAVQGTFDSPDPVQRSRFEAFFSCFEGVPFQDMMPILAPLERAKKRSGRKAKPDPDAAVLKQMHALLTSGGAKSVHAAAERFAAEAHRGGAIMVKPESTVDRLERKYRMVFK